MRPVLVEVAGKKVCLTVCYNLTGNRKTSPERTRRPPPLELRTNSRASLRVVSAAFSGKKTALPVSAIGGSLERGRRRGA